MSTKATTELKLSFKNTAPDEIREKQRKLNARTKRYKRRGRSPDCRSVRLVGSVGLPACPQAYCWMQLHKTAQVGND